MAWLGVLPLAAEEGRLLLRAFGPREMGLDDPTVWSATQDEHGVMYFGSDVVTSYDGERWRQYGVPRAGVVRGLTAGADGRLWVGALNEIGYFDREASGRLGPYQSLMPHLPAGHPPLGDVWHAFARPGGAVFITSDAVLIWNGETFAIHPMPGARRLPSFQIGNTIYLYHQPSGLWALERAEPRLVLPKASLPEGSTMWLEPRPQGWQLVTTRGLVNLIEGVATVVAGEATDFLRRNVLTSVLRLPDGNLGVGTLAGYAIIDSNGALKRVLTQEDGLPSRNVYSQFIAHDGSLWLTTVVGLTRVPLGGSVSVFSAQDGVQGRRCLALTQHDNRLIVATDDGLSETDLARTGPGRFKVLNTPLARYVDLASSPGGILAAGYRGVYRIAPRQEVEHLFAIQSDALLLFPSITDPGSYLVADNFDLRRVKPTSAGPWEATLVARLPDLPMAVTEDDAHAVWVGTNLRGAYRIRPGTKKPENIAIGGLPSSGRTFVGRLGGFLVVCTAQGTELHASDDRTPIALSTLPATDPLAISNSAPDGSLWLAFSDPFADGTPFPVVGRLALQNGEPQWQPFAIDGLDRIGTITRLFVDRRGIVWVGGTEGLLRLDPARLRPAPPPRRPLLYCNVPADAQVPPEKNTLAFQFSAAEYGRREALRFQTRLSADPGWSAPTDNGNLTLAGLRDGHHELSVRVIDDAGQTSPAATWRFTVLPPWYRTNAALFAWAVLVIASFIAGVHWRSAYLRRQNLRLEALVQKKTELLEQANAAKSEFIANMSHEIRNPISGIVGLSLAMEETSLDERQRQLTDSIRSCAALLATLVDDVLDFAKIEAGKIELRATPFALRESLEQCLAMVAEEARASATPCRLEIAADVPPRVIGDPARVQQIVLNYVTNAVKFGAGQPIVVGAQAVAPGRVRLFVQDHGPGVTAAEQATLFTKFTRLDRARLQDIRGTGLGLAVCRLLASKMGGSVGVESSPGHGARFWTELPLPDARTIASAPVALAAGPALRALIVEDLAYNATAMQAVLRKLGIPSEVAADGPTALAMLQREHYDVAFMDWNLPGMVGTEVVARYRAVEPPGQRTIILATTAYSAEVDRETCLRVGMDAFIAKPFTPEKIAAALRDLRGSLRAAASVEVRQRPASPPAAGDATLDLQYLQLLGESSPGGLAGQIDQYLASFEAERAAAAAIIPHGDPREIHRIAHRLSSHAAMVRSEPLARLAGQLQAIAASADRDRLGRVFDEFQTEFAQLRNRLDSIRSSPGAA